MSARKQRREEAPVPPEAPPAAGSEQLLVGDGSGEQLPPFDPIQERLAPPVLVEVKLLKPHTHADKDHPIGAKLRVSLNTEAWLKKHGVI